MALLRATEYCSNCGKALKERHKDQRGIPQMMRIIGDTFLGYYPCSCSKESEPATPVKRDEESDKIISKLKQFIRDKWVHEEKCKILSIGNQCECPLCLLDNLVSLPATPASIDKSNEAEAMKQKFAEHLGEKELNTTDAYAIEFAVKEFGAKRSVP